MKNSIVCVLFAINLVIAVYNGDDTDVSHQPWSVAVNHYQFWLGAEFLCTGALLSNNWVVTAAHCFFNGYPTSDHLIRLGSNQQTWWGEKKFAKEIIKHPKYNATTHEYDIALVKLNEPVDYSVWIRQIIMISRQFDLTEKLPVEFAGYGEDGSWFSWIWSNVYLKSGHFITCRPDLKSNEIVEIVCTEDPKKRQTPCYGDSGGGLTYLTKDGERYLVGVFSHHPGENTDCNPDINANFASIQYYSDWIKSETGIK